MDVGVCWVWVLGAVFVLVLELSGVVAGLGLAFESGVGGGGGGGGDVGGGGGVAVGGGTGGGRAWAG